MFGTFGCDVKGAFFYLKGVIDMERTVLKDLTYNQVLK